MPEPHTTARFHLCTNQLIAWSDCDGNQTVERLLQPSRLQGNSADSAEINPQRDGFVVITLDYNGERDEKAAPRFRSLHELDAGLAPETGIAKLVDETFDGATTALGSEERQRRRCRQRDLNFNLIQPLVDDPNIFSSSRYLSKQTQKRSDLTKRSRTEIKKYLRRYWQGGQVPDALFPKYSSVRKEADGGRKRGRKSQDRNPSIETDEFAVTAKDRQILLKGLEKHYNKKPANSLGDAYDAILEESYFYYEGGVKVVLPPGRRPSFRQFYYLYDKDFKNNASGVVIPRAGRRRFNLRQRPIKGNLTQEAYGPGEVYEIDSTIADIHLLDSAGNIIGRPTVYIVIDVFSRMIVGLCVTLEAPSYLGAAMALANAFSDKVAFCAAYGITISPEDWPCAHLCSRLKADRGELIFSQADRLVSQFKITVTNLPAYRADWKAFVERAFLRFKQSTTDKLPGGVRKARERGDKDPRFEAALTLRDLTKALIHSVLLFSLQPLSKYPLDKAMMADDVVAEPLTLWRWGMVNRTAFLRKMSPELVKMKLLPRAAASITQSGLLYRHLYFTSADPRFDEWMTIAANRDNIPVTIAYDPRLADTLCIEPANGAAMIACSLRQGQEGFRGLSWAEVDQHWSRRAEQERAIKADNARKVAESKQAINVIASEAKKRSGDLIDPSASKSSRVGSVKENRSRARSEARQTGSWAPALPAPDIDDASHDDQLSVAAPASNTPEDEQPLSESGALSPDEIEAARMRRLDPDE